MMTTASNNLAPLQLDRPHVNTTWLPEPQLLFAGGMTHCDPKVGIPLYGPRSLGTNRHKHEVHVGYIGTRESVSNARQFYHECCEGVAGDERHPHFPGFKADRGFRGELRTDDRLVELISRQEQSDILTMRQPGERFEALLCLLQEKLEILTQKDHPLDYLVLVLSQDLLRKCSTADYVVQGVGPVHRDLRKAFKAMAMRFQKPTQLLKETTGLVPYGRKLDHKSKIAWNLFTGLYFKADGLPWGPHGLPPSTCYIGVSFYRPLGESRAMRTSVAQAFDEDGEGLVLRGHRFPWDEKEDGRSPHLPAELADQLISMVLERYEKERNQLPQRVVVHKTSRFEPAEREGFEAALRRVKRFDLVSLAPTSEARLIRAGQNPPLRGTVFTVGGVSYLYTSGYVPWLGRYPHGHVPCALQLADHVGDTSRVELMQEVLTLTKMNWNSCQMESLLPITVRFSRLVGDILREVPAEQTPQPKYKFYM
ncbi:MAG TPA: hypothetical protein VEL76_14300 [Gemmataceae bacterium]|nr:hypothetical protein [Gemmataceae bacterium]